MNASLASLLTPGPTRVMGIVNVTPDSFSDGGEYLLAEAAIAHGRELVAAGADLIDVGGESTRPGADRVSSAEETRRVLPVVEALAAAGITVSVDTMRSEVATAAVAAGALVINDVSGGLADERMHKVVAGLDVAYVCMHWRAHSATMAQSARYTDVVAEVRAELLQRVAAARKAGLAPDRIILDPGLGFAKESEHNWELLRHLPELAELGHRLLVGFSRKRFLAPIGATLDEPRPPKEREGAGVALTTHCAQQGVWAVRTHTAAAHRAATAVVEALRKVE